MVGNLRLHCDRVEKPTPFEAVMKVLFREKECDPSMNWKNSEHVMPKLYVDEETQCAPVRIIPRMQSTGARMFASCASVLWSIPVEKNLSRSNGW